MKKKEINFENNFIGFGNIKDPEIIFIMDNIFDGVDQDLIEKNKDYWEGKINNNWKKNNLEVFQNAFLDILNRERKKNEINYMIDFLVKK